VDAWSSTSRRRSGGTQLVVLAGLAGSGKTELLRTAPSFLDLEGLACHRGSAFGGLGLPPQPSQPDFDAAVRDALAIPGPVVVEDEGPFVGSLTVPAAVCEAIETSPVVEVMASFDERVARLVRDYGHLDPRALIRATQRIRRRLGGPTADRAVSHFAAGNPEAAIATLLPYFDAAYHHRHDRLGRPVTDRILAAGALSDGGGLPGWEGWAGRSRGALTSPRGT
jgi:tRNA 2-selenouridine synthase